MIRFLVIEGGLNRALKHVNSGKPYAILTGHREIPAPYGPESPAMIKARKTRETQRNNAANKRLEKHLKKKKMGFKKVVGRGQEDQSDGSVKLNREKSYLVPGMKKKHAIRVAKALKQDYVVAGEKGKHKVAHTSDKSKDMNFSKTRKGPNKYGDTLVKRRGGNYGDAKKDKASRAFHLRP